jgi:hypothetical protein
MEDSVDEAERGCSGAWVEPPVGVSVSSCAGVVAVRSPDLLQMVSTSAGWPTAHTREVSGAFATENISLSLEAFLEIALGKAVQVEPSQCCVEAT